MDRQTVEQRATWWIQNGETGLSSMSIYLHMTGASNPNVFRYWGSEDEHWSFPRDVDDFDRCMKLLDLIPEWCARMDEMKKRGRVWEELVARWDEIVELYRSEIDIDYDNSQANILIRKIVEKIVSRY